MTNLNISLLPWQKTVWNSPARFKIVAAGRRTGKTEFAANQILFYGLSDGPGDIAYVAPTIKQAKKIMWKKLLEKGEGIIKDFHVNDGEIKLINGRVIHIFGADNPDSMRGIALKYLVLDEYADIKDFVWEEILRPTLSDYKGDALFIGTPKGRNHFYELYLKGLKDDQETYKSWHYTSYDNPYVDKEEVDTAKNELSSHAFRQEYLASFESAGGEIFKEDWIKVSKESPSDGDYFVAIDLAGFTDGSKRKSKKLDSTAIAVVKANHEGWYVEDIVYGRWDVKETAQHIFHTVAKYRPIRVGIEKGSLKNAVTPYLSDLMQKHNRFFMIDEVTHGNQKKTERIVWSLQGRFENGRVTLNDKEYLKEFLDQLFQFPNPLVHDDLVDALSYIDQVADVSYASENDFEYDFEPLDPLTGY